MRRIQFKSILISQSPIKYGFANTINAKEVKIDQACILPSSTSHPGVCDNTRVSRTRPEAEMITVLIEVQKTDSRPCFGVCRGRELLQGPKVSLRDLSGALPAKNGEDCCLLCKSS